MVEKPHSSGRGDKTQRYRVSAQSNNHTILCTSHSKLVMSSASVTFLCAEQNVS